MKLPKICPNCKIDFGQDAYYYVRGIQYCNGMATDDSSNLNPDKELIEIDLGDASEDWIVNPYEISCGECKYILWEKPIIVNAPASNNTTESKSRSLNNPNHTIAAPYATIHIIIVKIFLNNLLSFTHFIICLQIPF